MPAPGQGLITAANLVNWIPTVWATDVISAVENSLVVAQLYDRSYEQFARGGGDTIVIPRMENISAHAVNTQQGTTVYQVVQNAENISLNQKMDIAVAVDDINQIQTNPKYFEKIRQKMAYGLANIIDTNCSNAFRGWSNSDRGTLATALKESDLIGCYEDLNGANAPFEDRAWVFDAESITDLINNDFFTRMDYVPDSIVRSGFQGKQIFGSPVYMSTNLYTHATNEHVAGYFHREATALVVQMQPEFEIARLPLQHADAIIGMVIYGIKVVRPTFGTAMNTRS